MVIDEIRQELANLNKKIEKQEKQIRKAINAIKRIGTNMNDFDFDELLNELEDNIVKEPKNEENEENTAEIDNFKADENTDILDELEKLDETIGLDEPGINKEPEVSEAPEEIEAVEAVEITKSPVEIEELDKTEVPEDISAAAQAVIQELENKVDALKAQVKALKTMQQEEETLKVQNGLISKLPELEYSEEAKSFLKEYNSLEMDKKAIQEKMKELKDEYKDQGVNVAQVLKAQKEIIKEIKETSEEAEFIAGMKELIKSDDNLMATATMFAG